MTKDQRKKEATSASNMTFYHPPLMTVLSSLKDLLIFFGYSNQTRKVNGTSKSVYCTYPCVWAMYSMTKMEII